MNEPIVPVALTLTCDSCGASNAAPTGVTTFRCIVCGLRQSKRAALERARA